VAGIATFVDAEWSLCIEVLGLAELGDTHDSAAQSEVLAPLMSRFPQLHFWATISDTTAVNPAIARALHLVSNKCQIHVLQRPVVAQIFKKLSEPFDHIASVINYFKSSPCAAAALCKKVVEMRSTQPGILPGNETKLVKMNTTRWTSTRNAVARCCQLLPAINAVLDERNEALRIPRTLAEQLVEIEQLLAPVAETTELLEARGRLMCEALSTMVACIRVVKSLQFRNQLVVEARNAFLTDLLLRLEKDDTLADLMFFALLDPRYRALPFSALLPVGIHEGHKCIPLRFS